MHHGIYDNSEYNADPRDNGKDAEDRQATVGNLHDSDPDLFSAAPPHPQILVNGKTLSDKKEAEI
jgi:hypothetical protein